MPSPKVSSRARPASAPLASRLARANKRAEAEFPANRQALAKSNQMGCRPCSREVFTHSSHTAKHSSLFDDDAPHYRGNPAEWPGRDGAYLLFTGNHGLERRVVDQAN